MLAPLLIAMWACPQTGKGERMTVELDVFSGRPNPKWTLTEGEAVQVEERLRDLPQASEAKQPGLGYRGFVLMKGKRRVVVGSGVVRTEEAGQSRTYRDSKGLEGYLLGLARAQGYGKALT